jgi:ferredoxin
MAMQIVDECVGCGACEPACPHRAIGAGDPVYVVDASRCTECVGVHARRCEVVCPIDGCFIADTVLAATLAPAQRKYAGLLAN